MSSSGQKFYQLNISERIAQLAEQGGLTADEQQILQGINTLTAENADHMIENAVGIFPMPLGFAQHFVVNGRAVLVPMVIEEPSVVAGASFMAKLAQAGGGFTTHTDAPEMIGQVQLIGVPDPEQARERILAGKDTLLKEAAQADPMLISLGGGPRDIEVRILSPDEGDRFLVVHLIYDVRDAMGANAVNTAVERIAPLLESLSGGKALLRILSNLADRRLARATCTIPLEKLGFESFSPEEVRDGIIDAYRFAATDPYRAATHNKGIMNGVDAVVIATGNDWRAVEAGAHAYAARSGRYTSLSTWSKDEQGNLIGSLEMPMAVGIVGGATRVHPTVKVILKLMNIQTAAELAGIIVSVGLAQNLAALRALATEGIQRGHMSLHARQIAVAAGASSDLVDPLADQMVKEKQISLQRAQQILLDWQNKE
ncbi:MAG: hydroxymethylglutaryl-CoA reductase, degradative [Anaerolineaceae bacterium]|nr:hydroxymethylglutaryl-CoA reductase, degradative [Anaerolineaceae bacterium]